MFLSLSWRRHNLATVLLAIIFGLTIGGWRGSAYMQKLSVYQAWQYQKVNLIVTANEDGVYGSHKQLAFNASRVILSGGRRLPGRIQVSGFGENAVFQGDEIAVTGKLYPGYGAYQGRVSFAKIQLIRHHVSAVSSLRRKFVAGMQTALPEPLAPFAMGLLIGQRATLPDAVKQDLLMVGLTHIIAVSGYNLTIILRASQKLLSRRSKRLSTLLSLGLIGVFLLLTGASASIVRAAIVSMLSIVTGYYGRSHKPLNLLASAALITAWANPFYLWGDLSWYLSFLAFYGVMVLSPLVQARWPRRWQRSVAGGIALESLCAEIMSLPLILHVFGQMSLIGLLANVLVAALIPLAMLLSAAAGLAGMVVGANAGWLAWPARMLLEYMLDVAHILAGIPHVFIENHSLALNYMLVLYGIIAGLTWVLWHKTTYRPGIITDMKQVTPGSSAA